MGNKNNQPKVEASTSSENISVTSKIYVSQLNKSPEEDYVNIKAMGQGTFGKVFKVKHRITGLSRAMKVIPKSVSSKGREQAIFNEIEVLKTLDHPNVLKIFEIYSTDNAYYLVTELCQGGELFDKILSEGPFDESQSACLIYQILSSINYCHNMNIVHRDLKPENIFIEKKEKTFLRVKVGDFGTATTFDKGSAQNKIVGSSYYIAPEVLQQNYNEKCDLWSCGVILYMLLSSTPPFGGDTDEEIIKNVKTGVYSLKGDPWDNISKKAKDLISNLLEVDVNKRFSAEQALNHPWFKSLKTRETVNALKDETLINKFINNIKQYKIDSIIQEAALAYLVHNYTQIDDIKEACKFFSLIDKSLDGKVTKNELYSSIAKIHKSKTLKEDIDIIFSNLDRDNNGYIQYEEFIRAAIDKEAFLEEKVLKYAFNYFDVDRSGEITIDEIEKIFKDSVVKGNVRENLEKIILEIDSDKNGSISFDEFSTIMAKLFKKEQLK